MPKVPDYNLKPLKTIYNPVDPSAPASMKQKNFILTLCERRKINKPDLSHITKGQAADLISTIINS